MIHQKIIDFLLMDDLERIELLIPISLDTSVMNRYVLATSKREDHKTHYFKKHNDPQLYVSIINKLIDSNIPFFVVIRRIEFTNYYSVKNNELIFYRNDDLFELSNEEKENIKKYNLMEIV